MNIFKKASMLLLAAVMLASCGNKNESADNTQKSADGKSVVRFAMWDKNQEKIMKEIADKYMADHKDVDIQVELGTYKDHFTKLETQAQGEVMPDIFFMNAPNFLKFASNDVLAPLDDVISEKKINMDDFPDALKDMYKLDGKQYGIPKDWDLGALWYNKEIFDEAGVEYPTDDWTWNDMVEACRKIKEKNIEGVWPIAAPADTQTIVYDTIPQAGGFIINEDKTKSGYDSPEAIEGVKAWVDLIEEGLSPNLQTLEDTKQVELFKSGKLAMVIDATWNVPEFMQDDNIKDKIDIVKYPYIKQRAVTIHGLSYCMPKSSANNQAAKDFLAYLASPEINDLWAESGVVIPANNNSLEKWLGSYPNVNLKAFTDQLEYSHIYPYSKNTSVWNAFEAEELKLIWSGEKSVEDGLKDLATQMNEALDAEK